MSDLPKIQVTLTPKRPIAPAAPGRIPLWPARRVALWAFAAAWILMAFLATVGAPIFGVYPYSTSTDRAPYPEQSRLTWGWFLTNALLGTAAYEGPSGNEPVNISTWWSDVFYYCSYLCFVASPLYFLLRRWLPIVFPWAFISAVLFSGYWWSGEHSFDKLPTTGIYRPYTLWGFYGVGAAMSLMTVAMIVYEYACWREFVHKRIDKGRPSRGSV